MLINIHMDITFPPWSLIEKEGGHARAGVCSVKEGISTRLFFYFHSLINQLINLTQKNEDSRRYYLLLTKGCTVALILLINRTFWHDNSVP